jgi:predicted PurR-regulated permease PerM
MQKESSRPRWSSQTKLAVAFVLLAIAVFLLYRFRVVIGPLILAIILSYILSPVASTVQARLKFPKAISIFLAYVLLIVILALILMIFIPLLANQLSGLNLDFQRILNQVETLLGRQIVIAGRTINVEDLIQQFVGSLQGILEPAFGQTVGIAFDVISSLVWIVFIVVVSFYLIKDAQALRSWLESLVPPVYRDDYIRLRGMTGEIWAAFFRGQLVLGFVVATIFTVAGFILGLPFALAMGVLAGLLEFLPSIGHAIWLTIASILAFFLGSTWMPVPNWVFLLIIVGFHLIFQQFDLNYLLPRIIGRRVQLPPLVVIIGIVSGALLAGVLGIFLAAPTIASARVIGRYIYANLFDMDPFPDTSISRRLPPPDPQWWRRRPDRDSVELDIEQEGQD